MINETPVPRQGFNLLLGVGDDAAVWQPEPEQASIETTDLLIQGVHFSLDYASWEDIGWKAMAVNISDIAAMGGQPAAALITTGLSPEMLDSQAVSLFQGLARCGAEYGVTIVGGDTVASPIAAVVGVCVYGQSVLAEAGQPRLLRRDAARVGDVLAVTGPLGAAACGLRQLQAGARCSQALMAAHLRPQPRVREGQACVRAGLRCGMDISDGLLGDLAKICVASGVGAIVRQDHVPVPVAARTALGDEATLLALTGGEDYELLVVGPEEQMRGLPLTIVGEVVQGSGVAVLDREGKEVTIGQPGYDAFL